MSKQSKLFARSRSEAGSTAVKAVRARDAVPAVIYGKSLQPQNIEINRREFEILLAHAAGESILVDLEIESGGEKTSHLSLVQEVQHHPLRRDILHVDFQAVSATDNIEASIPLELVGESDGVKNFGGLLELILRELPIRCLPKDLPDVIPVDVSHLGVGDSLHVKDLILPSGVTSAMDGEVTVLSVVAPKVVATATAAS
jgi:large subunit ribosomal protein L25